MILTLSTSEIVAWEMNPRKRIDDKALQPLIDSIRAVGWFGTIMVRPLEGGLHQVLAGERRWRAAKAVGLETLECDVREMDDKAAIELAVVENRDREDLDIIEEAGAYKAMVNLGWTVKEIASRSGKSERSIYLMLELCELDDGLQEALRDRQISMNTATVLGRIEDEAARSEALVRIVKPRVQDHPLSEKQALPLIQREYLDPQKRQAAWAKKEKWLRKEYGKDVEIFSVADAGKVTGFSSGYECCEDRPGSWELAVHMRGKPDEEIPTWGELAEKHGARRVVVPDGEGNPVFYVEREPLETAVLVAGEEDPENCIFPLKGAGRHEQSLENERDEQEEAAREKAKVEETAALQKDLVKTLYQGMLVDGGWDVTQCRRQVREACLALIGKGQMEGFDAVANLLGVDLEALGDGNAIEGEELWLRRICGDGGMEGAAFLLVAYHIANLWVRSDGARGVMDAVKEALEPKKPNAEKKEESEDDDEAEAQCLKDAHVMGYSAFSEGKRVHDNPFTIPAYSRQWEEGWLLACVEKHPEADGMNFTEIEELLAAAAVPAGKKKGKKG